MRVLLVQDDEEMTGRYRLALEGAGHEVLAARSGAAGIELAGRDRPDLVLLDVDVAEPFDPEAFARLAEDLGGLDLRAVLHAVSHELRTPLTSVIGFSSLLVDRLGASMDDDALELAVRIRSSAGRLSRLLDDLLDLDRLSRGVLDAQRRAVPVDEVIQHTLEGVTLGERDVRVEVDPPQLVAQLDPVLFERIVENLLVNAVRHTPVTTTIEVRASRSMNGLLLVVEDDGPGIPADLRDAVFEPFRRNVDGGGVPGTGIGLSLVARFAELHGGRAWVEERPGGGASFRVVLGT